MKNHFEAIRDDLGELQGFQINIEKSDNGSIVFESFPNGKSIIHITGERVIWTSASEDNEGAWAIRKPIATPIHPISPIPSHVIEECKRSGLDAVEFWMKHFIRDLQSTGFHLLAPGIWKVASLPPRVEHGEWTYRYKKVEGGFLAGTGDLRSTFTQVNPNWNEFAFNNIPLPIRTAPASAQGRVKYWRKKVREGTLPPLLLFRVSQLNNFILLDGHCRLTASLMEDVQPSAIALYRVIESPRVFDKEKADQAAEHIYREHHGSDAFSEDKMNESLIRVYNNKPFIKEESYTIQNMKEEEWDQSFKECIQEIEPEGPVDNMIMRVSD